MPAPLAPGSVSLRLYPPALHDPGQVLDELTAQAVLAHRCGFDGVMLSERHGGAWGQIPNPLQAAGWLLDRMPGGWVAPCPILLPFRNASVVAEELAWLDARFPGRVGAGFGSGGNEADFVAMGVPFDERGARFDAALRTLVAVLRPGAVPHALSSDRAIARVNAGTLPLVSAAMNARAVERAAELGVGVIGSSLLDDATTRRLVERYRRAGGTGPHVVILRLWLGDPPWALVNRQLAEYRRAPDTASAPPGGADGEIDVIADAVRQWVRRGPTVHTATTVQPCETIGPLVKGPLTVTDLVAYRSGVGAGPFDVEPLELALRNRMARPGFYDRTDTNAWDARERLHWDEAYAISLGHPSAFDYSHTRLVWAAQLLTDWMGDAGRLLTISFTRHEGNYVGDTQWLSGQVESVVPHGPTAQVTIIYRATNQTGAVTASGRAVVVLPMNPGIAA